MAWRQDHGERSEEEGKAVGRLSTALEEQERLTGRYDAAVGTAGEVNACAQLREAGEQVAAREAWVRWLDRSY